MKLFKASSVYPAYLKEIYAAQPDLPQQNYLEQKKQLDQDCFGWYDIWSSHFPALGWEVFECASNAFILQQTWLKEQGMSSSDYDQKKTTLAQLINFAPDILFIQDHTSFDGAWVSEARAAAPSIQKVVTYCGAPFDDDTVFKK